MQQNYQRIRGLMGIGQESWCWRSGWWKAQEQGEEPDPGEAGVLSWRGGLCWGCSCGRTHSGLQGCTPRGAAGLRTAADEGSPAAGSSRRLGTGGRGTGVGGRACMIRSLPVTHPRDEGSSYPGCQASAYGSAQIRLKPHTLPDLWKCHSRPSSLQGKEKRSAGDHTLRVSHKGGEG